MSKEPEGLIPQVPFARTDLEGIEIMVRVCYKYLQQAPRSVKNTRRLQTLQQIQKRLTAKLAPETGEVQMLLNMEEVEELLQAMLDFNKLVRSFIPKDQKREEVLESVNLCRQRLLYIIKEFDT